MKDEIHARTSTSIIHFAVWSNLSIVTISVYEIKMGTLDEADTADSEWRLHSFMNTAKKRKYLGSWLMYHQSLPVTFIAIVVPRLEVELDKDIWICAGRCFPYLFIVLVSWNWIQSSFSISVALFTSSISAVCTN